MLGSSHSVMPIWYGIIDYPISELAVVGYRSTFTAGLLKLDFGRLVFICQS